MYPRLLLPLLRERLSSGKIVVLYGARQVGKSTLLTEVLKDYPGKVLRVNADARKYVDVFESLDPDKIRQLVSGYDLVFIDEAQRIREAGLALKILHDEIPQVRVVVSGSSSLELANHIREPLTGRTLTSTLYPLAFCELAAAGNNTFELANKLESALVFGLYPAVFTAKSQSLKEDLLSELSSSYLYRDVLALEGVKNPKALDKMLRLLAYQIGNEVSINELAGQLGLSAPTADRYLRLLEQSFVVFRVSGFSRNLRKEVTKMDKIYFYDTGVRNAIIDDLRPLDLRGDVGQLWENFLVAERRKLIEYKRWRIKQYFWRVRSGAEVDYVEESAGKLEAWEFKWEKPAHKAPAGFTGTYPDAKFGWINRQNFVPFVTGV